MAMSKAQSNLTGVGAIDLGIGAGDTLRQQVAGTVDDQKKRELLLSQQRQQFPSAGMMLGVGNTMGTI
jgi:hypothetical protein